MREEILSLKHLLVHDEENTYKHVLRFLEIYYNE
jgi:hypothetical protein